jgi:beta-glucosidase
LITESAGPLSYYPSPWMSSNGEWADAYRKAADFVSQLTLLEKVNLTTGVGIGGARCLGQTGEIPRMNFSGLCLIDTPNVVDFGEFPL